MHLCFATSTPFSLSQARQAPACSRRARLGQRYRVRPACGAEAPPPPDEKSGDNGPNEEHDIPQSAVDWNSEWSKFQADGMRSMAPRGREPVSKEELAASRTMSRIRSVTDKVPTRQQLFRDWRFWVAIIATLSLFSAFVQSSQTVGGPYGSI